MLHLIRMCLQIDFFARDELITIVPNFSIPTADKSVACIMVCCCLIELLFFSIENWIVFGL